MTFFTAASGDATVCILASDGTDSLTRLRDDQDASSEELIGALGAAFVEAIVKDPITQLLYGADADELGSIDMDTGSYTTIGNFGVALAANGDLSSDETLNDVDVLGFHPSTGVLYAVHKRVGPEVLFQIDVTTGAFVPGAFGGDDYLLVDTDGASPGQDHLDDIAIDALGVMYATTEIRLVTIDYTGTGTTTPTDVGDFGTPNDMEGLSVALAGNLIGTTGTGGGSTANSLWDIDTATGLASNQRQLSIGFDYEGVSCYFNEIDLEVSISVDEIAPDENDTVFYTITVTNTHDMRHASGVELTNPLPSGLTFVSFTSSKPTSTYDGGSGLWTVGVIPPGTTYTLTLEVTVDSGTDETTIPSTVEITFADNPDDDSTPDNGVITEDDLDGVNVYVGGLADLSIDIAVDDPTPLVGTTVVFSIIIDNSGPTPAPTVNVEHLLPAGYTYASDDGGGAYVPGTGLWDVGNLSIGDSDTLEVTATVNATGGYASSAEVVLAGAHDPDSDVNTGVGDGEDDQDVVTTAPIPDADGDGVEDAIDPDDDDDGVLDVDEGSGAVDTDGDGLPDGFDIDADGDGIVDNVEAQSEGGYVPPSGLDTDGDGLDDAYDPDDGGTPLGLADTDGDGRADVVDLDSDDDAVPDAIEGHDADLNGVADVVPIGADADGDGLDDAFDTVVSPGAGNATGSNSPLQDADGDGVRDWRDTDDEIETGILLRIRKSVARDVVIIGDLASYTIALESLTGTEVSDVTLVDETPPRSGTACSIPTTRAATAGSRSCTGTWANT